MINTLKPSIAPVTTARPIRLLIVDDHATLRRGLCSLLSAHGPRFHIVAEVGTAQEALMHAELTKFDVVLTDLQMKPMGGIEMMPIMKQRQPTLKFVVLTGATETALMLQAYDAGAAGFVVKESEDGEIVRAIESVFENATHYPAALHGALQRRHLQPAVTPREGEVLMHIAEGKSTKEIGSALDIESRTVDAHRGNIKQRFNLKTGAALIHFAIEWTRNKGTDKRPDKE